MSLNAHTKNAKYKNKWGEVVKRVATADEMIEKLESQLKAVPSEDKTETDEDK